MSCTCQICKKQYSIDLIIPDEYWEKIKPEGKPKDAGLLCGSCIMKRLEILVDGDFIPFITLLCSGLAGLSGWPCAGKD